MPMALLRSESAQHFPLRCVAALLLLVAASSVSAQQGGGETSSSTATGQQQQVASLGQQQQQVTETTTRNYSETATTSYLYTDVSQVRRRSGVQCRGCLYSSEENCVSVTLLRHDGTRGASRFAPCAAAVVPTHAVAAQGPLRRLWNLRQFRKLALNSVLLFRLSFFSPHHFGTHAVR